MNLKIRSVLILFFFFMITREKMNAQNTAGFIVEVFNETNSSVVKQIHIESDYIKSLPPDSVSLTDKHEKSQLWIGAGLLSVLEEKAGISYNDISKLAAASPDGYNSVIFNDLLPNLKTAILAYNLGREDKWLKKYGYMRLIFPGLREMYFVDNPGKIIVYVNSEEKTTQNLQLYFLDKNEWKDDTQIPIEKILSTFNLSGSNFSVLTTDSLKREYLNNELMQKLNLKKEKSGTWKISGEKVPVGLRTRNIFYLYSEDVGIFLKSLSEEEITLWENYLKKSLTGTEKFRIEIVRSISENYFVESSEENQIYKTIVKQLEQFHDADYIRLVWYVKGQKSREEDK